VDLRDKATSGAAILPEFIGSPIEQLFYSIDCFLASSFPKGTFPVIYAKLLFIIVSPVIYLLIFLLLYLVYLGFSKKRVSHKGSVVITSSLFIFLYLQPNVINYAISLLSCVEIGAGRFYIKADTTYTCYTDFYYEYSLSLVLPIFLFFAAVFPLGLLIILIIRRKDLNRSHMRLRLGFIYNEYTQRGFYWEIVKMLQRMSIIMILNFFDRHINLKAVLILLVITVFGMWAIFLKPYASKDLDKLDRISITTCFFTIFLGLLLHNNIFNLITYFGLFTAGILNIYFIGIIFKKISFSYYLKFLEFIDKKKVPVIKTVFQKQITRHLSTKPSVEELDNSGWARLKRAYKNFKTFKSVYSGKLRKGTTPLFIKAYPNFF
jgi:hypothetical protein